MQAALAGAGRHLDQIDGGAGLSLRMNGDMALGIDAKISAAPTADAVHAQSIFDFPLFRQLGHKRILTRKREDKATIPASRHPCGRGSPL